MKLIIYVKVLREVVWIGPMTSLEITWSIECVLTVPFSYSMKAASGDLPYLHTLTSLSSDISYCWAISLLVSKVWLDIYMRLLILFVPFISWRIFTTLTMYNGHFHSKVVLNPHIDSPIWWTLILDLVDLHIVLPQFVSFWVRTDTSFTTLFFDTEMTTYFSEERVLLILIWVNTNGCWSHFLMLNIRVLQCY